jgi:hypothetical protein
MERRTAPPPAEGRPRQLGNGGFNKALMPAQVASLSPYNNMEREKRKSTRWMSTHWDRPGHLEKVECPPSFTALKWV